MTAVKVDNMNMSL